MRPTTGCVRALPQPTRKRKASAGQRREVMCFSSVVGEGGLRSEVCGLTMLHIQSSYPGSDRRTTGPCRSLKKKRQVRILGEDEHVFAVSLQEAMHMRASRKSMLPGADRAPVSLHCSSPSPSAAQAI